MRKNLTPDDLGEFLQQPVLAVLATRYQDGSVLLSPVWHEWRDGGFTVLTGAGDVKSKHLHRDRRASIVVAEQEPPYRGLEVRGAASLQTPADIQDVNRRIAVRYLGDQGGNAYADTFAGVELEMIRLTPGVLRGWDFADDV